MRNIIGQTKSSFDIRDVMDNKKILLVNLSKGRTGELNSKLLGMIFVMKFQAAAMSRANIPENDRVDFSLYVDEFQNFSTDSFATILSEARKFHLNLIVANQFTTQLTEEIRDAVFGNIGTIISFRVGTNDAEFLAKYFAPVFDTSDLQRVPNHNAIVRMLIGGVPSQSFSMASLPPLGSENKQLFDALKQLSAAKYGRPRAEIEAEIFERLKTIEPAKPAFGAGAPGAFGAPAQGGFPSAQSPFGNSVMTPAGQAPVEAQAAARPASFLDDWLSKRNSQPARPVVAASPFGSAPAVPAPAQQAFTNVPVGTPTQSQPMASSNSFSPNPFAAAPTMAAPAFSSQPPAVPQNVAPWTPPALAAQQPVAPLPDAEPLTTMSSEIPTIAPIINRQTSTEADIQADTSVRLPSVDTTEQVIDATPQANLPDTQQHNLSSNELEEQEVAGIANELRHNLGTTKSAVTDAEVSSMPTMLHLVSSTEDHLSADDTISIDKDGNIISRSDGPA